jgi:hypothetical protein
MLRKPLIVLASAIGISAVVMVPTLASADGNGTGPGWGNSYIHDSGAYGAGAKRVPAKRTGREISALAVPFPVIDHGRIRSFTQ